MVLVSELKRWVDMLDPKSEVAVADDGLALVEVTKDGRPGEASFEVGGIPKD
jgi:hypothetical protein